MTEKEWLDIFGDNLIALIKETKISQQELADATGLSRASISSYINKRRIPTLKAIINLAYVLDVDVSELVDYGEKII